MAGAVTTTGGLTINCELTIAGNTLDIGGDMTVTGSSAKLQMLATHASNRVIVRGAASFNGNSSSSDIEAGSLELKGDFSQTGSTNNEAFSPSEDFVIKFSGTSLQTVTFDPVRAGHRNNTNGKSHLSSVDIVAGADVNFASDVYVDNDLSVRGKLTIAGSKALNVKTTKTFKLHAGSQLVLDGDLIGSCKKHGGSGASGTLPLITGGNVTQVNLLKTVGGCAEENLGG
jgi:hypothetical protein